MSRALFTLWALFWLLMIIVAVEDHRDDSDIHAWEPLLWEGSSCLVATGWLLAQRRVSARWQALLAQPLRWYARHFAWLPIIAITFVVLVYALRHGVYVLAGESYEHPSWPYILFYESIKLLLFASLWLGIIFGLESFASWRHERERLLALQKHLAESQLSQLKAQLRPHFLFNALNTISSLMQVDVQRADRLLNMLADLLRASLQTEDRHMSALREELEVLRLYGRIMEERFAGRVELHWAVEDDALEARVPSWLLQPLLENAFKHGVERRAGRVRVEVEIRRSGERLHVVVRNGGELRPSDQAGIGLRNSRERLAVLYGDAASLTLSAEGTHVATHLTLPFQAHAA
jgi:hypothetical protein